MSASTEGSGSFRFSCSSTQRASAATIAVLNKMYVLSLDAQPLIEQAVEIEQSMGKIAEEFRLPLCPMADANKEKLKRSLKDYGLI